MVLRNSGRVGSRHFIRTRRVNQHWLLPSFLFVYKRCL